ncbi:MAG: biopolymer transporter ExbD [Verrucomicrobia bacterium]|nr:biopolymer transporter ExbD [Verrucomicrobiota bacterium]
MSASRRRMRRVHQDEVGLQIAPMIDVTLLLLFFFMLAGKITKGEKLLDIKVPIAATGRVPVDEGARDVVNIDEKGQLFSGSLPMTTKELTAHLKQRFKDFPPLKLYIRADSKTPGKKIKEVMAIASEAGAIEVIFGVIQK